MARLDLPLSAVAEAVPVSVSQLSKLLRGRALMDLEQFDAICNELDLDSSAVWAEAKLEALAAEPVETSIIGGAELSRRLGVLVHDVAGNDRGRALGMLMAAASHLNLSFSRSAWLRLLDGGEELTVDYQSVISRAFGIDPDYLVTDDPELVQRFEGELAVAHALESAGVTRISARGALTPEALQSIRAIVESRTRNTGGTDKDDTRA